MTFQLILFYLFAAIILYGALQTVLAKNPVHATLHLVLTFCVSAMMWIFRHYAGGSLCGCGDGVVLVCRDDAQH